MNQHGDYHNLHELLWVQGLNEGFARNNLTRRPWVLARSGTSGMQRYGVSMWSGDIWPALQNMASSLNMQMHMSFVGIGELSSFFFVVVLFNILSHSLLFLFWCEDYYGSDVGGFQRKFLEQNEDEKYTQWFANSAWFDFPLRPHTWQPDFSPLQSAPSRVGDLNSNLFNLRTRISLVPYFYSVAHMANRYAVPVVGPMVMHFPGDQNLRKAGHQKIIGKDILVAISASEGQRTRQVYLPAGRWIQYYTDAALTSNNEWFPSGQLLYDDQYCGSDPGNECLFVLPVYVRSGAIIPHGYVDQWTRNAFGERDPGNQPARAAELTLQVYPDMQAQTGSSEFTIYEDDGETIAYKSGAVLTTHVSMTVVTKYSDSGCGCRRRILQERAHFAPNWCRSHLRQLGECSLCCQLHWCITHPAL